MAPVKTYVGAIAQDIAQSNPNLSFDQVLNKTAEKAYKTLGIQRNKVKAKKGKVPGKRRKPAFAKPPKGGRKAAAKKTKVQSQIDELIELG